MQILRRQIERTVQQGLGDQVEGLSSPLSPTNRRARARDASSRVRAPLLVLTNRGVRAAFSPATTALARFSCNVRLFSLV